MDEKIKKESLVKMLSIFPKTEGLSIALFSLITMSICIYFIYVRALNALQEEIKEGLVRNVSAVATTLNGINGDLHKKFRNKSFKNDPVYIDYLKKLENIRQASKYVRYLYTNIMIDGKVYFIANPSPQNDNDGDGKPDEAPQLMDPYPDAGEALVKALKEKVATVDKEPYTDKWGTFYSAYAPFYDSKGNFEGTIGMDLELAGFNERLLPIKTSTKRAYMAAIVLAILSGTAVWFFRRITIHLNKSRMEIALLYLDTKKISENATHLTCTYLKNIGRVCFAGLEKISQAASKLKNNKNEKNNNNGQEILEINEASQNLSLFMHSIDEYSNYKLRKTEIFKTNIYISKEIEEILTAVKQEPGLENVSFQKSIDKKIPELISGDSTYLRKIFRSLLTSKKLVPVNNSAVVKIKINLLNEGLNKIKLDFEFFFPFSDSSDFAPRVGSSVSLTDSYFNPFPNEEIDIEVQKEQLKLAMARELITGASGELNSLTLEEGSLKLSFSLTFDKYKEMAA